MNRKRFTTVLIAMVVAFATIVGPAGGAQAGTLSTTSAAAGTATLAHLPAQGPGTDELSSYIYGWYFSYDTCHAAQETIDALPIVVFSACHYEPACYLWALVVIVEWALDPADMPTAARAPVIDAGPRPTSC